MLMRSRWRGGGSRRDAPPQPGSSPRCVIRVWGSAASSHPSPSAASWFGGCTPLPWGEEGGRAVPVPCRPLSPVGTALPGRRVGFWRAGGRARPGLPAAPGEAGAQRHREREPRAALRRAGPAGDPRGGGRGLRAASLGGGAAVTGSAWAWAAAARRGVPPVGVGGCVSWGSGSRVGTLNPRCSLP